MRIPAAGAKGTPRNPGELKDDTSASREDKRVISQTSKILCVSLSSSSYISRVNQQLMQIVMRALSSAPFKEYRVWWSLSDSKYGGTAMFIKKHLQPKKVSFCLDRTGILLNQLRIEP